ncbi:hypothetical protein SDC9_47414 [bioreactor metagenome]|uniref:Uncharacterized protein n=1 Tax=bioreactor metagenome TaxID=1076179 RepID=A0A644WBH2_9ZZZZ
MNGVINLSLWQMISAYVWSYVNILDIRPY